MALPPSIELLLRQGARNVGKINARTGAISNALQPYAGSVQNMYAGLQQQQQSLGDAVSQQQSQLGSQLGSQITNSLQGIQAPGAAVSQFGGGTAQTGAAAGQAIGGLSAADYGRLRGEGSAEAIYAAALPRLAQLAGDQERRQYLSELGQDLSDLALKESQNQLENAKYEREWRYKVQQDRLQQKRDRRLFRYQLKQDAYKKRQEKLDRARQARLDKLATQAAAKEYGLSVYDKTTDNQRAAASAAETARHHRETEAQARAREARQAAKDKSGGKDDKVFYDAREDAFKRAREYANPKSKLADPMPKAKARTRLWAEFGAMLVGRGYDRAAVNTMISRALEAAGY